MKIAQIGEAILQQPAKAVSDVEFGSDALNAFCQQLLDTMQTANGVGIAAPQMFDPRQIMIIASRPNPRYPHAPEMQPLLMLNPVIEAQSEQWLKDWEGCLSVPGLRGHILRPASAKVRYQDINGESHQQMFEGFVARIFWHEYDHLIGKTWLDHVQTSADIMANEVWQQRFGGN